jgi:hypothetical protein
VFWGSTNTKNFLSARSIGSEILVNDELKTLDNAYANAKKISSDIMLNFQNI